MMNVMKKVWVSCLAALGLTAGFARLVPPSTRARHGPTWGHGRRRGDLTNGEGRFRAILDGMSGALAQLPNDTSIEGHTDDLPISGGPFPSNWELSTARATTVLRYLVDAHHLPPNRLSAAGYADQRPLVPNDSPAHRSANRRVEVVVLSNLDQQSISQGGA